MIPKTENQYYVQGEGTSPIDKMTIYCARLQKESQKKACFSFHFRSISLSLDLLELKSFSRFKHAPWKSNSIGICKRNQHLSGELNYHPSLDFLHFDFRFSAGMMEYLETLKKWEICFFDDSFSFFFAEADVFPPTKNSDQNFIAVFFSANFILHCQQWWEHLC